MPATPSTARSRRLRWTPGRRGGCAPTRTPNGASASAASTSSDVARPLYVGRRWVHDEEQQQIVVNWQAPAARPFYTATPQRPARRTLRRRFRTDGRRLLDIADEALDGSMLDGATVGDFLLEELERTRGRAHARHRRDDPDRPVPADHARPATCPSSSRAAREPARRRSACTAPPGCSTPRARSCTAAACS